MIFRILAAGLTVIPLASYAQTPFEITPQDLVVQCQSQIKQLHPTQDAAWWDSKCECYAQTATEKMRARLEVTGGRETSRNWRGPMSEAYLECEIV